MIGFSLLYLLIFTFIYIFVYYDLAAFLFILIIICAYSFPSLFAVLILLLFERMFKFKIHELIYVLLSIAVFYLSFLFWNYEAMDSKNLYPIYSHHIHVAIYYAIASHASAYGLIKLYQYIKIKRHAA